MALETSINVCIKNACTTIVFKETTGAYNVTTNATGWGSPNEVLSNATAAVLTVIDPSNVSYTINLFTTGDFPTDNPDFEYEIPLASLGGRTVIEDGYWQFIYTVTASATKYIATKTAIFTCNSACCVNKLLLLIDEDPNDTSKTNLKRIANYQKAKLYLDIIKHYAYCGSLDKFTNLKLILDKLCSNSSCNSCN